MSDILGKANCRPPGEVAAAIRDKLTSHGVLTLARSVSGITRLLHIYDLDDDWSDLEGLEDQALDRSENVEEAQVA